MMVRKALSDLEDLEDEEDEQIESKVEKNGVVMRAVQKQRDTVEMSCDNNTNKRQNIIFSVTGTNILEVYEKEVTLAAKAKDVKVYEGGKANILSSQWDYEYELHEVKPVKII